MRAEPGAEGTPPRSPHSIGIGPPRPRAGAVAFPLPPPPTRLPAVGWVRSVGSRRPAGRAGRTGRRVGAARAGRRGPQKLTRLRLRPTRLVIMDHDHSE